MSDLASEVANFVTKYWPVGGAASVFATGFAAGRFFFQGILDTRRAEAELYKSQRDDAIRRLEQNQHVVKESDEGSKLKIKAMRNEARAKAAGRLFSSLATILLLSLVGYSVYLQTVVTRSAAAESLRNVEFQKKTEASLRALQPKPVIQQVTKALKQTNRERKPQAKPDAETQNDK